ncbi:hypothetical protein G7051_04915 [Dysgonomonas sp. HDW5B]|uniref:hypothetical protein n=1 Tax=Dysgonomonas sp. HDW5B TaxID=2714927 RepID=UPI00140850AC|nr:hypothetical protein [Dysgonomonas sp. HDW5B]QIK53723.1 hypothetical protein G7051_04915 [Dysgonomonas sp. HDW5B]
MDFKARLSQRIGMDDINEILRLTHDSDSRKQELYDLVIGDDEAIGYHAAWIFTHFSSQDNEWLYTKQDQLIDNVLACKHGGKRRVMLNLLYRQPFPNPPRVDFLDFCLERMMSGEELPGVKSLCMKIAYELCRPIPELKQELKTMLAMMEGDLVPSIRAVRRNILNAMHKEKSLQKY